jgi:hypothetical protein
VVHDPSALAVQVKVIVPVQHEGAMTDPVGKRSPPVKYAASVRRVHLERRMLQEVRRL